MFGLHYSSHRKSTGNLYIRIKMKRSSLLIRSIPNCRHGKHFCWVDTGEARLQNHIRPLPNHSPIQLFVKMSTAERTILGRIVFGTITGAEIQTRARTPRCPLLGFFFWIPYVCIFWIGYIFNTFDTGRSGAAKIVRNAKHPCNSVPGKISINIRSFCRRKLEQQKKRAFGKCNNISANGCAHLKESQVDWEREISSIYTNKIPANRKLCCLAA